MLKLVPPRHPPTGGQAQIAASEPAASPPLRAPHPPNLAPGQVWLPPQRGFAVDLGSHLEEFGFDHFSSHGLGVVARSFDTQGDEGLVARVDGAHDLPVIDESPAVGETKAEIHVEMQEAGFFEDALFRIFPHGQSLHLLEEIKMGGRNVRARHPLDVCLYTLFNCIDEN